MTLMIDAGMYRFPVERETLEAALALIEDDVTRGRLLEALADVEGDTWHVSMPDGDVVLDVVSRAERASAGDGDA